MTTDAVSFPGDLLKVGGMGSQLWFSPKALE